MMEITEIAEISEYTGKVQQHSPFLQNEQDYSAQGHPMTQPTQCLMVMGAVDIAYSLILICFL
ncbi:hypothetical protein NXF25_015057 [Crotalus adamanteus]|uniref:Uncharacterized protein n=1 Tax=Crotalus adamanteus TaxID=8729 RepID=A0AAW1AXN2_CROAD